MFDLEYSDGSIIDVVQKVIDLSNFVVNRF